MESPVFIVGPPRSGTTLLQRLLVEEFRLSAIPETHFYSLLQDKLSYENHLFTITADQVRSNAGIELSQLILTGSTRREVFENYLDELISLYDRVNRKENTQILEKTPGHAFCISEILKDYPKARIIALIRDPRESILSASSLFYSHLTKTAALENSIDYWKKCANSCADQSKKNLYLVRYEDLVHDPEEAISQIASWASLSARIEKPQLSDIKISITTAVESWKNQSFKSITKTNMRTLSFRQIVHCYYIDYTTINERMLFGYRRAWILEILYQFLSWLKAPRH